jgi:hypothetical protein
VWWRIAARQTRRTKPEQRELGAALGFVDEPAAGRACGPPTQHSRHPMASRGHRPIRATMQQRREAFAAYCAGGRGSLPLHQFFERYHATDVTAYRTGLMLRVPRAGYLLMPWDCYDTALATATHEQRAAFETYDFEGKVFTLVWPALDVHIAVGGLVWDASLPEAPPAAGGRTPRRTRNVVWMSRMPAEIRRWVAPGMKAAGRAMPAYTPVPIRTLEPSATRRLGGEIFTESTGCAWCDLEVSHSHHLDEL